MKNSTKYHWLAAFWFGGGGFDGYIICVLALSSCGRKTKSQNDSTNEMHGESIQTVTTNKQLEMTNLTEMTESDIIEPDTKKNNGSLIDNKNISSTNVTKRVPENEADGSVPGEIATETIEKEKTTTTKETNSSETTNKKTTTEKLTTTKKTAETSKKDQETTTTKKNENIEETEYTRDEYETEDL